MFESCSSRLTDMSTWSTRGGGAPLLAPATFEILLRWSSDLSAPVQLIQRRLQQLGELL
jgi:hypothetical protein